MVEASGDREPRLERRPSNSRSPLEGGEDGNAEGWLIGVKSRCGAGLAEFASDSGILKSKSIGNRASMSSS